MAKTSLPPGFRFHPTDVELVWYYLKRKIMGKPFRFEAIAEVELYKFAPWDLPVKSCLQSRDLEWYFFCPRDRKYANGTRANRATDSGYWKTSGNDRTIVYDSQTVGMKKTLIFHLGKPPRGTRTDWVMYEFRLESVELVNAGFSQDAFVVCKIFQKSGAGPKNGEQYGAPFVDEDWDDIITDNAVALPWQEPSYDHPSLSNPAPSQSVHFEVGGPSLAQYPSEAGAMSSVPAQSVTSEFCETLSMLAPSKIGQQSSIPELSYADVILLEQLEEFLNTSPPHGENSSGKMLVSPIVHEDANGMLNEDAQAVYGQLDEGSHLPGIGLDDILLPDIMGCEEALQQGMGLDDILSPGIMGCEEALQQGMGLDDILSPGIMGCDDLHHLLSEFTGEKYVEINDLNFLSANGPFEFANTNDTSYPFANNSSAQDLSSTFMDSVRQVSYDAVNDDLLQTLEDTSWSNLFPWQKDRLS